LEVVVGKRVVISSEVVEVGGEGVGDDREDAEGCGE
jgi:hypothetical protein